MKGMNMKKKIKITLINAASTIIAALIGVWGTKNYDRMKVTNAFTVDGNIIIGNANDITDDDISKFVKDYLELQIRNTSLSKQNTDYSNDLKDANNKYERLEAESNDTIHKLEQKLKEQKVVILSSPDLKVLGENIDTPLINYVASIDGHTYYSEDFLNTFLPNELSINDSMVQYGRDIPEKVNVVSEGLIYDDSEFDFYNGNAHFTMSLHDYNNGLVNRNRWGGTLSIAAERNYSKLSFVLGHVDNTGSADKKLIIYYLDTDGEYKETYSVTMHKDIPVDTITVPIYNTKTVKIITTTNSSDTQYGLADIYLIK